MKAPWDVEEVAPVPRGAAGELFAGLEKQYNLPTGLLDAVWATESGRGRNMRSPVGAQGHFQFMPGTAARFGLSDPYDLQQSAAAASKYYRKLLDMFGGDLPSALAGYNWGEGNVQKKGLGRLPAETRGYIAKITGLMGQPAVGGSTSARGLLGPLPEGLGARQSAPAPWDAPVYVNPQDGMAQKAQAQGARIETVADTSGRSKRSGADLAAELFASADPREKRSGKALAVELFGGGSAPPSADDIPNPDAMTARPELAKERAWWQKGLVDPVAGVVHAAHGIGNTMMIPLYAAQSLVTGSNPMETYRQQDQRFRALERAVGADPDAAHERIYKQGGDVALTLPVGGALGTLAGLAKFPKLAAALASGGFSLNAPKAVGLGGRLADLATRTAGGAATGAVSAGLVHPDEALTGAAIGGALPAGLGALSGTGNAIYQIAKALGEPLTPGMSGPSRVAGRTLLRFAQDPAAIERAQGGVSVTGAQPTLADVTRDPGLATLQEALKTVDPQTKVLIEQRLRDNNAARVAGLDRLAGDPVLRQEAVDTRRAATAGEYAAAEGREVEVSPKLEELFARPDVQTAIEEARRHAANQSRTFGLRDPQQPLPPGPVPPAAEVGSPFAGSVNPPPVQPPVKPAKPKAPYDPRRIDIDRDDALTALRKLGGLNMQDPWVGELAGRFKGMRRSGFGLPGAERSGGQGLDSDQIVENLYRLGYIQTPDWHAAEDVLMRASRGERVMSVRGDAADLLGEELAAARAEADAQDMIGRGEHPYRHPTPELPADVPRHAPPNARPATLDDLEAQAAEERRAEEWMRQEGDDGGDWMGSGPGGPAPGRTVDGRTLQDIKVAIDSMLADPTKTWDAEKMRALRDTRTALIGEMEKLIPEFNTARTRFAEESAPINKMDLATYIRDKAASTTDDINGIRRLMPGSLTRVMENPRTVERATSRQGLGDIAKVMGEDDNLLRAIVDEVRREAAISTAGTGAGSKTAGMLSAQNILHQMGGALGLPQGFVNSVLARTVLGQPLQMAYKGVAEPRVQQALAEAILNPDRARAMIRAARASDDRSFLDELFRLARQQPKSRLQQILSEDIPQGLYRTVPVLETSKD